MLAPPSPLIVGAFFYRERKPPQWGGSFTYSSLGGMSMSWPSKLTGSMLIFTLRPSPLLNGQAAPTVVKMSRPSPSFCPVLARTL